MTEEQVTRTVMEWLYGCGWEILDYDFPGGGTGRRFRFSLPPGNRDKNTGAFCPDIIAWKDGAFVLFENKAVDTISDYDKQVKVKDEPTLPKQLESAYPGKNAKAILVALAFSGSFSHREAAVSHGLDFVLSVADDRSVSVAFRRGSDAIWR